ncbi:MAG: hypothetical protein M3Q07_28535 [Pseudobdellovibrionaceae bacterium]|nr:hypothetical protein [Pseudobdellovibrionaceae bacterium]
MSTSGEDLKLLIEKWAAESPETRDQGYLERKSGVHYNTINRVWHGRNPDCQTALAILNIVCSKRDGLIYLKKHFPPAAVFHESSFTTTPVFSDVEIIRPLLDHVVTFVIANLAYARHSTRTYIRTSFGEFGIDVAEKLAESQRFYWKDDLLVPSNPEDFFSYENKEDLVKACQHIIALAHGKRGFPTVSIGALNDEEYRKFKMILREFCAATRELILSNKGGSHAVALATVFVDLAGGEEEKP